MIDFLSSMTRLHTFTGAEPVTTVCLSVTRGVRAMAGEVTGSVQLTSAQAAALAELYSARQSGVIDVATGHVEATYLPAKVQGEWDDHVTEMRLTYFPRAGSGIVTQEGGAALATVKDLGGNFDVIARALQAGSRAWEFHVGIERHDEGLRLDLGEVSVIVSVPRADPGEDLLSWLAQTLLALDGHATDHLDGSAAGPGLLRPGVGLARVLDHRAVAFEHARLTHRDPELRSVPGLIRGPLVFGVHDFGVLYAARLDRHVLTAYLLHAAHDQVQGALSGPPGVAGTPAWLTVHG